VPSIAATAGGLAATVVERAAALGLHAVPPDRRAPHYVGLRAGGGALPPDLAARLAARGVYVSVRGGASLRVTPHVYNTAADVDRLLDALAAELGAAGARA
jgi:selenocysteine lyase/cysteine desulfurase